MSSSKMTPARLPGQLPISVWEIEAAIGALRMQQYAGEPSRAPHLAYEQGVLDALHWILGRGGHPLLER